MDTIHLQLVVDRWFHVMAGVVWIGLLYYFNFVQAVAMPKAKADNTAGGITKHIAPLALLWFRYAALVTWLTGSYYLSKSGVGFVNAFTLNGSAASIGVGAWLGTIMFFNVWVIIWPNQKKVLGLVQADDATKAKAARLAFLASRTNVMLSIPMLFFMVAGSNHGLPRIF